MAVSLKIKYLFSKNILPFVCPEFITHQLYWVPQFFGITEEEVPSIQFLQPMQNSNSGATLSGMRLAVRIIILPLISISIALLSYILSWECMALLLNKAYIMLA